MFQGRWSTVPEFPAERQVQTIPSGEDKLLQGCVRLSRTLSSRLISSSSVRIVLVAIPPKHLRRERHVADRL